MRDFIKKNYAAMTYKDMAAELGVGFHSITKEVKILLQLGEIKRKNKEWTEEDDNYLFEEYNNIPKTEIARELGVSVTNVMDRYHKLKSGVISFRGNISKKKLEREMAEVEKIEKQYSEILARERKLEGTDLSKIELKKGITYKLANKSSNKPIIFRGRLIQICENHLVFRTQIGYCESFLKADLIETYEIKEEVE